MYVNGPPPPPHLSHSTMMLRLLPRQLPWPAHLQINSVVVGSAFIITNSLSSQQALVLNNGTLLLASQALAENVCRAGSSANEGFHQYHSLLDSAEDLDSPACCACGRFLEGSPCFVWSEPGCPATPAQFFESLYYEFYEIAKNHKTIREPQSYESSGELSSCRKSYCYATHNCIE
jgi:hypothetical protein